MARTREVTVQFKGFLSVYSTQKLAVHEPAPARSELHFRLVEVFAKAATAAESTAVSAAVQNVSTSGGFASRARPQVLKFSSMINAGGRLQAGSQTPGQSSGSGDLNLSGQHHQTSKAISSFLWIGIKSKNTQTPPLITYCNILHPLASTPLRAFSASPCARTDTGYMQRSPKSPLIQCKTAVNKSKNNVSTRK